jgi:hypothetical protein
MNFQEHIFPSTLNHFRLVPKVPTLLEVLKLLQCSQEFRGLSKFVQLGNTLGYSQLVPLDFV